MNGVQTFALPISILTSLIAAAHSCDSSCDKQSLLLRAISSALNDAREAIRRTLHQYINQGGAAAVLKLSRLLLATKMNGGKILWLEPSDTSDLFVQNLCTVRRKTDCELALVIDEPLTITLMEEILAGKSSISQDITLLESVLEQLGLSDAAKGSALEPIVNKTLQLWSGTVVSELPFLKDAHRSLPRWCSDAILHIEAIGRAQSFGYPASHVGDAQFLANPLLGKLLVPMKSTRPDCVAALAVRGSDGALIKFGQHFLLGGCKFQCSPVEQSTHDSNVSSTEICKFFCKANGKRNVSTAATRHAFIATGCHKISDGSLRIHVEIPFMKGVKQTTEIVGELGIAHA